MSNQQLSAEAGQLQPNTVEAKPCPCLMTHRETANDAPGTIAHVTATCTRKAAYIATYGTPQRVAPEGKRAQ